MFYYTKREIALRVRKQLLVIKETKFFQAPRKIKKLTICAKYNGQIAYFFSYSY